MSDYDKNFLNKKFKELEEELSEPTVRKPNDHVLLIDGLNTTAETIKNGMVNAADYHANAIKQALATQGVKGDQGFGSAERLKAVHEGTLDPTKAKMNDDALRRHREATDEAIEYLGTEAEYIKRLMEQKKGGLVEFTQKYAKDNKQIKKSGRMKAKGTNESTADFLDRAREAFIASVPAYKKYSTNGSLENPTAYKISKKGITLPSHFLLNDTQIKYIANTISLVLRNKK